MIALSFALPEESKGFIKLLSGARRSGPGALPVVAGTFAGREITVVHSGMGMESAMERVADFLAAHAPSAWIAAGFGGALSELLKLGEIVAAQNFSDASLLDAISALPARRGGLVSTKHVIETVEQKLDLGRHTGAIAVDMETAGIHRLCSARGIPVLAIRAISDTALQDLPVPARVWFNMKKQRPRPMPLVLYLAVHPGRIGPFIRFVRGVNRARGCLTDFLAAAIKALPEK